MNRPWVFRVPAVLAAAACLAACQDNVLSAPGRSDGPRAGNRDLDTTIAADTAHRDTTSLPAGSGRILIDASRDGGVWWYPQWVQEGNFDPEQPHQGQLLAAGLRAAGYEVRELPRPFTITRALLDSFDLVIRAGAWGGYEPAEVSAYREWVAAGGRLLLLEDHMKWDAAPADSIGNAFGLAFEGVTVGVNVMAIAPGDSITDPSFSYRFGVGSGLRSWPAGAVIMGRLSDADFLDLDADAVRDGAEPAAPAVMGRMRYGQGRIVFCGDVNLWEWVPQPLLKDVLNWLTARG